MPDARVLVAAPVNQDLVSITLRGQVVMRTRTRTRRYVLFPCRRATFLSCTYAGNMCSTWRELDLGQWKQSVLKDFLYRHSAPAGPTSRERPG
jgi:hypothetical protein